MKHLTRRYSWIPAAMLAAAALAPVHGAAESRKAWSFKPDKGFVDDPIAFDANDAHLAYVHTDSATFLKVVVVKTDGFKTVKEFPLKDATTTPRRLLFTADSKRVVLIWKDSASGKLGATAFVMAGKAPRPLGPAQLLEVVQHKGQRALTLTNVKQDRKGNKHYSVQVYRAADFKRVAQARVTIQYDQTLKGRGGPRLMYWEPGHLSFIGLRRGKYDKKRDIRLPDVAVRYDVLQRKETWKYTPQKLMDWSLATNLRPNNRDRFRFLSVSDDHKKIYYVDRGNALATITLPVKWVLYEPKSLRHAESWDGDKLYFSVTIDPVNKPAVKRRKADKERLDLYRLDAGPKATPLGQVLTHKRRFGWQVGAKHFSYLRKLKGFGRGGDLLTIYKQD